ncbi:MAG TPA: hypothetical protein VGK49_09155, partial [Ilumatobacteraceae bacterium]
KRPVNASAFVKHPDVVAHLEDAAQSRLVIGHTRLPTQGPKENPLNNHPIETDTIVGVHNGTIANDYEIFTRSEVGSRRAEVDSGGIFALLSAADLAHPIHTATAEERCKAFAAALGDVAGSMAIAFMSKFEPNVLYLAKGNSSPLEILDFADGSLYFSSELAPLNRLFAAGLGGKMAAKFSRLRTGELWRFPGTNNALENHRRCVDFTPSWFSERRTYADTTTKTRPPRNTRRGSHASGAEPGRIEPMVWLGTAEDDFAQHPILADADLWSFFNDVGGEKFVGCMDEVDQASVLGALATNLFRNPTNRRIDVDLALAQRHLQEVVRYVVRWMHNDKDTRNLDDVKRHVYQHLGVHLPGEAVMPTSNAAGLKNKKLRIAFFPEGGAIQPFSSGRVAVLYDHRSDACLRSMSTHALKPVTDKPTALYDRRLDWLVDAALAYVQHVDDKGEITCDMAWLDPTDWPPTPPKAEPPANDTTVTTPDLDDEIAHFYPGYI